MEKINPLIINDGTNEYTLEFSRETVKFAELRGFNLSELTTFPNSNVPALFYYAFRKNHPNIGRNKTDKILYDTLGGLTADELTRLVDLYNAPGETLIIREEDGRKNSKVTVIL